MSKLVLIAIVAAGLALAGCGGDDDTMNVLELRGDEYAYIGPEQAEGGMTTLRFTNTGEEPHEFALARLADGKTIEDVETHLQSPAAEGPPPAWVTIVAGVPTVAAGETVSLTQDLRQGTHVLLCFLSAPDGKSHIAHGMLKAFDVRGDAGAEPPAADAVLELDGDLAAPDLEAGERTLELRNDGAKPGSVFIVAFNPGRTDADLRRWEESDQRGPAPARFLGGAIDVPARSSVYYTLRLDAGRAYTLLDDEHGIARSFTPAES